MSIQLSFLGTPDVKMGDHFITLDTKYIGLLAYLAVERKRCARRKLMEMFWGGKPQEKAQGSFRTALYEINNLLPDLPDVLIADKRFVLLNEESMSVDVWEFEKAFKQKRLEQAVELYRGEFLDELILDDGASFDQWYIERREHFHKMATEALELLLSQADEKRVLESVMLYARRLIALEPWHEEAYRHLMLAFARQGNFNEALAIFEECQQALKEGLRKTPAAETLAVYDQIQLARMTPRRNLPFRAATFLGRQRELAEASKRLLRPDCCLLTLTGPGGIGKTRLAIEIARQKRGLFLHGLVFVSLESQPINTEDGLVLAIARVLDLSFAADNVLDQLLDFLRPREMLLVLDSFEQLTSLVGVLYTILKDALQVKILVTSREGLDVPDECHYEVEGMGYPAAEEGVQFTLAADASVPPVTMPRTALSKYDALAFFERKAEQLSPHFSLVTNIPEVIKVCQLIEGLPLAIELVAPWTLTMSCAEIATKIATEMHALIESERNYPERHRSLQVVFEHSWQLLTPEEQQVFQRLGVFRGDFFLPAAEHVANATQPILESLTKKSMIRTIQHEHYNLHALLRAFALEKLQDSEALDPTLRKHGDYYVQFIEARLPNLRGPNQLAAFQELEQAFDNIRAAWIWGVENAPGNILTLLIEGIFQLCNLRNWYLTGIELFQLAAEPVLRRGMIGLYGRLLLHEGLFHMRLGQYDLARQRAEAGQDLCEKEGDQWGIARALYILGWIDYDRNQYDTAEALQTKSLNLYYQLEDGEAIAGCLRHLGLIATLKTVFPKEPYKPPRPFFTEHYPPSELTEQGTQKAIQFFIEALQLYREARHSLGEALTLHCLGFAHYVLHDYGTAVEYFRQAVAILRQLNAASDLTQSLNWLAWTSYWHGKPADAKQYFLEALEIGLIALANKRLLDCLMHYAMFLYLTERDSFVALAINVFVAQHPNTDERIRVFAKERQGYIGEFMLRDEGKEKVARATAYGQQQTFASLVYTLLSNK